MENLYAAASGDLPVGWRGTGLDARQKALLLSTVSSLFQPAPTAYSAFRPVDRVVSSVLAEALPLIAAKMRRFAGVPDKK